MKKAKKAQRIALCKVTPQMAEAWLKKIHPHHDRGVIQSRVEILANDIKAGNWKTTLATISFDKDGNLLDGRYRLLAVLLADKDIETLVAEDEST